MVPYTPPEFNSNAFNCPHCNAYANQNWYDPILPSGATIVSLKIAICTRCKEFSLWFKKEIIYPEKSGVPGPNLDLRDDIQEDYKEAKSILNKSPRGAAALLRLCIQKLCQQLGEKGSDLNEDIKNLVSQGLSPVLQQSLDIVRVIGNESVHPGQIDLSDDPETATKLFALVNTIADVMISQPKHINKLYESLPEGKRKGIEDRDKTSG